MKAIISELWETGIDIISTDNEPEKSASLSDLRKCDNVIVGDKGLYGTEIMLDDNILYVAFRSFSHPTGCGRVSVCVIN